MKRSLWIQPLTERSSPAWPCPACGNGTLALVPESLLQKQTSRSFRAFEVLGEPEAIKYRFSAWLKCSQQDCGEDAALVGEGELFRNDQSEDEDGRPIPEYSTILKPLFCSPMPDMFELPEKCPDEVKLELRAAFQLFWSDQAASAGRVRVSLERLMDHCRIPKRAKKKKGGYYRLMLDDRIKLFSQTETTAGKHLMALKWLGNTASHQGNVSRDDLLDGFEILEYLLAELFDKRANRVDKLAQQLSKRHDPLWKKRNSAKIAARAPCDRLG